MANVIEGRLVNDIGNKLFALPKDVAQVESIQKSKSRNSLRAQFQTLFPNLI